MESSTESGGTVPADFLAVRAPERTCVTIAAFIACGRWVASAPQRSFRRNRQGWRVGAVRKQVGRSSPVSPAYENGARIQSQDRP